MLDEYMLRAIRNIKNLTNSMPICSNVTFGWSTWEILFAFLLTLVMYDQGKISVALYCVCYENH